MIFELSVILIVGCLLLIQHKLDNKTFRRFAFAFIAVYLFQYFTQALWINQNLEPWAYLYLDVSWILTVGWAGIIVTSMKIIDLYSPKLPEGARYVFSVIVIGLIGFLAEWTVVALGIRHYPAAVREVFSGVMLGYGKVPIETLYYIPVFMALMVAFVRYWEIAMDSRHTRGKKK